MYICIYRQREREKVKEREERERREREALLKMFCFAMLRNAMLYPHIPLTCSFVPAHRAHTLWYVPM